MKAILEGQSKQTGGLLQSGLQKLGHATPPAVPRAGRATARAAWSLSAEGAGQLPEL